MISNVAYVASIAPVRVRQVELSLTQDGKIVTATDCDVLGYEQADLVGKNVHVLVPPQWRRKHESYLTMFNQTAGPGTFDHIVPLSLANGAVVPVSLHHETKYFPDEGMRYFLSITVTPEALVLILGVSSAGTIDGCLFSDELVIPFLGYSRNELMGGAIKTFFPRLDIDSVDGTEEHPMDGIHKNGSKVSFLVRYNKDDLGHISLFVRKPSKSSSVTPKEADLPGFVLGSVLGRGSFGVVRLAVREDSKDMVAIKLVQKASLDAASIVRSQREGDIMKTLSHRNVIPLYQIIDTPACLAFVMMYCRGGEVCTFRRRRPGGRFTEQEAHHLFSQLANAVSYLHGREIIHRDIKLKNLLIEEISDDVLCINTRLIGMCFFLFFSFFFSHSAYADFGLANYGAHSNQQTFCGTPAYAAPEMILADSYRGGSVDVWYEGVFFVHFLSLRHLTSDALHQGLVGLGCS